MCIRDSSKKRNGYRILLGKPLRTRRVPRSRLGLGRVLSIGVPPMSAALAAKYPLLDQEARTALRAAEPNRFHYQAQGGAYLNLRGLALAPLPEIDEARIANPVSYTHLTLPTIFRV